MFIHSIKSKYLSVNLESTKKNLPNRVINELKEYFKVSTEVCSDFIHNQFGMELSNTECYVTLCGNNKIKGLNNEYLNKNKVTDVLSFPLYKSVLKEGIGTAPRVIVNLGDIFICYDEALRQSKECNITCKEEIISLFVHGFLHLCGYDHELSKKDEKEMFALEEKLVKSILAIVG